MRVPATRIAVAWSLAASAASAGCFYVDPINQRPSLDIRPMSSDPVYRGGSAAFAAIASDPERQLVSFQWRAYACTDATSSEGCDLNPIFTGVEDTAAFIVPAFRGDPDGPGPLVAPPVEALRVVLEGRDDHGATAKPAQELPLPVLDHPPDIQLRVASKHGTVVTTPIDVYAKYGDPDDTAENVTLEWTVFSPSQVPDTLVDLPALPRADESHLQQGKRFTPAVIGNWDIRVVAIDRLGARTEEHLTVTVADDRPPCLDAWDPLAGRRGDADHRAGAVPGHPRPRRPRRLPARRGRALHRRDRVRVVDQGRRRAAAAAGERGQQPRVRPAGVRAGHARRAARPGLRPPRHPDHLRRRRADLLGDLAAHLHPAPDLARGGAMMEGDPMPLARSEARTSDPGPMESRGMMATRSLARSRSLVPLVALLAACGAGGFGPDPTGDGGSGGDASPGCSVFIEFEPDLPIAGPATVVRANGGVLNAPGVLGYTWGVTFGGAPIAHAPAQADGSAITFPAVAPGVYVVRLDVDGASSCPTEQVQLNVRAPGGNQSQVRLHVAPPASETVPPLDKLVSVLGGANFSLGTVVLDPGMAAAGTVRSGGTGVAAYLRFMPSAAPEAAVEVFANASGAFSARVVNQPHDVLVIPTVAGYAPRRVEGWTPFQTVIPVGAGTAVTGTVRGPSGAALVGAKVQLKIGEVPSTVATTAANGGFSVLVEPDPGAVISIDVTPPAGSGLPRLAAQSQTLFDLAQPVQVSYAASLTLRDLAGTTIRRQGAPVANAKLVVVGSLAAIGTVTAGATPVTASGVVRIAAAASAAGVLPAMLAPARPLSAVVEVVANDLAVTAIDLTAGTPATIDAPPAVPVATQLRAPGGAPIESAFLDAVPAGALALAGVTSTIRGRSGVGGQLSTSLAAGGRYDLRIHDPLLVRGAPLLVAGVTAQTIAGGYALVPALAVTGKLALSGNPTPVGGAAVQILCSLCTGLERSRPLAEGTSAPDGAFTLVVPDPGVN